MKAKKMLSTFCAACMLLSILVVPGSAAETRAAYAGTTMSVQVSVVSESKEVTTTLLHVPIPALATEAQASALVREAASQTEQVQAISATPALRGFGRADQVSTKELTLLYASPYTKMGGGTLSKDYKALIVEMTEVFSTTASSILLRVNTTNNPTVDYDNDADIPYSGAQVYIVYVCERVGLTLGKGDEISVYAKVNNGSANVQTTTVYADPNSWA